MNLCVKGLEASPRASSNLGDLHVWLNGNTWMEHVAVVHPEQVVLAIESNTS
jgi:hypothetical protein